MYAEPVLDKGRSWSLVLLALMALSSLGFAILGFVLGPELAEELELQTSTEQWVIPGSPDLNDFQGFWEKRGFYPVRQEKETSIQQGGVGQPDAWLWNEETWYLVPTVYENKLSNHIWELVSYFLAEGWSLQIESVGSNYTIGFWSNLPQWEERVLAHVWHLQLLEPKDYEVQMMGWIPVLGSLFDPDGHLRGTPKSPVLAIIIDDWGYQNSAVDPILAYPFPLTVAILPHLPVSRTVSRLAHQRGHEVILHQPLEALNSTLDLGPGGILMEMGTEEKVAILTDNLASLPEVVGVNNHMGSRATEDWETMAEILQAVKDLDLFFVDSHTSNASVVPQVARDLEVAYGVNNLFIDNESDIDKIKEQIRKGLTLAKKQGHATVIGHVRPATAIALWEMIPEILEQDVALVPISRLLY